VPLHSQTESDQAGLASVSAPTRKTGTIKISNIFLFNQSKMCVEKTDIVQEIPRKMLLFFLLQIWLQSVPCPHPGYWDAPTTTEHLRKERKKGKIIHSTNKYTHFINKYDVHRWEYILCIMTSTYTLDQGA
jgi:hypothetical protein